MVGAVMYQAVEQKLAFSHILVVWKIFYDKCFVKDVQKLSKFLPNVGICLPMMAINFDEHTIKGANLQFAVKVNKHNITKEAKI